MTTSLGEPLCPAECTAAARAGAILFRHRGWIPVVFLVVPLIAPGEMSAASWAGGLGLLVLGEAIRLAGVAAAGTKTRRRSRGVQRLVTYGIFGWMRNPLYVGNLLVWLGVTLISGVFWFIPITMLLFAIEYGLIVRYEEGVLESHFGAEYVAYKARVPRWIPRPPLVTERGRHDHAGAWRSELSTLLQYGLVIAAFVTKARLVD